MKMQFLSDEIARARRETVSAGLQTTLALETDHMIMAIVSLVQSDALMIASDFRSWLSIVKGSLTVIPISHILEFSEMWTSLHLIQHRRTANSLLHQWVANEIAGRFNQDDRK